MKLISREDLKTVQEYEPIRASSRREVIELKKSRRVLLGDCISVVFENRRTVVHQIQEMMRTEHIYDEGRIRDEIEIYNALIPGRNELSATLFIEIDDPASIKPTLDRLQGIDTQRSLALCVAGVPPIRAVFESGHSNEEKISAVHYIRFVLDDQARQALRAGAEAILMIDHPGYRAETVLNERTRRELLDDLEA